MTSYNRTAKIVRGKGPSGWDLVVALRRGDRIFITIESDPNPIKLPAFIDNLAAIGGTDRHFEDRHRWHIGGHFDANGIDSWLSWPGGLNVWGNFTGEYNSRTREGTITPTEMPVKNPFESREKSLGKGKRR